MANLAHELEVSIMTIRRDVDDLCQANVPLYTTTGPYGGVHALGDWVFGESFLTKDDEVFLLGLAKDINPADRIRYLSILCKYSPPNKH